MLALCFDGCIVQSRLDEGGPSVKDACKGMEMAIHDATDLLPCAFSMKIKEKEMYGLYPTELKL